MNHIPALRPQLTARAQTTASLPRLCAAVDRSGRYSSPIASSAKRFAATIGELTGGRVGLTSASGGLLWARCLGQGSAAEPAPSLHGCDASLTHLQVHPISCAVGVLKAALTIAVRYSAQRQQFGPPDAPEVAVLDYPSQQVSGEGRLKAEYGPAGLLWVSRRWGHVGWYAEGVRPAEKIVPEPMHFPPSPQAKLMPMLATCYALNFAKNKVNKNLGCWLTRTRQVLRDERATQAMPDIT